MLAAGSDIWGAIEALVGIAFLWSTWGIDSLRTVTDATATSRAAIARAGRG
jgi:hypothetical protein